MKSLVDLLEYLLLDCGRRSAAPVTRDVKTLRARAKHEGDSFVTITLPSFCSDFERSLDLGRIAPGSFTSFKKWKSGIPSFLKGFLRNVFGSDGVLLQEPSIDCIRAVRQICLYCKKLQRPCTSVRTKKAIESYKKCDEEVDCPTDIQLVRWYGRVADILMSEIFPSGNGGEILSFLLPSHGPGATAEGILGNQKFLFRRWHNRLSFVGFTYARFGVPAALYSSLPLDEFFGICLDSETLSTHAAALGFKMPALIDPCDEAPVRVVLVPKTLKTPRIIAVEPVCMQYAQQAISKYLVRQLDHCRLTRGHINFDDQRVNQGLAMEGSRTGDLATLDLSEASDRVSKAHVDILFRDHPEFLRLVMASRSTRAQTPDGEIISLKKFASMGSALCFPVESLVFFTSIIASRLYKARLFPTAQNVSSFSRSVYVYGDDLIVPADEAAAICDSLETLGFRVNRRKSFWTGKFRESCGADCYDNELVTPVYQRRDLPADRRDSSGIVSAVATANQLWSAGYTETATAIRKAVEKVIGPLPNVSVDSPAVGWFGFSKSEPPRRSNRHLQRSEDQCWVPTVSRVPDPLDGIGALAKCVRKIKGNPLDHSAPLEGVDAEHLESSPRRYGLALKRRWVPSYRSN